MTSANDNSICNVWSRQIEGSVWPKEYPDFGLLFFFFLSGSYNKAVMRLMDVTRYLNMGHSGESMRRRRRIYTRVLLASETR